MPKSSGINRDVGLNHPGTGSGKGDADRSPGWREHYDDINWNAPEWKPGEPLRDINNGFREVGRNRIRKVYGQAPPVMFDVEVNTSTTKSDCVEVDDCTCRAGQCGKHDS